MRVRLFREPFHLKSDMILSGGIAGCVLAGRLAENPDLSILLVEAGPPNEEVPASAMPAAFVFP